MKGKNFVDEYFEKYQNSGKKNFGQLSRYLSKLSEKKCNGIIDIGGVKIPNYIADPKLGDFSELLRTEEGWSDDEKKEVKSVCRAYLGIQFENDQECLGMLELINGFSPDNRYESLIKYLTDDKMELDTDSLIDMMNDGENPINPLIASYILTTEINDANPFS